VVGLPFIPMILTQTKIIYEIWLFYREGSNASFSKLFTGKGCFVEGGGWRVVFRSVIKRGFS
jgi:hypothetical protein